VRSVSVAVPKGGVGAVWREALGEAGRSLRGHRLRFGLTSLGVLWGTAMLTLLLGYTDGYDRHFQRELAKLGPRVVWGFPGVVVKERVGERGSRRVELEREDVARVASLAVVEAAAPSLWLGLRVLRRGPVTKLVWAYGADAASAEVRGMEPAAGRFLGEDDVESAARVLFLGADAARRLFGEAQAVGRTVRVDGVPFRVVGVGRRKGDQIVNMGPRDDELALMPITTAQRRFTREDSVGVLVFAPVSRERSGEAMTAVRELLSLHHGFRSDDERALEFFDIQEAVALVDAAGLGIRIFLISAGLVTLLVGAVGVMNIMLVVVGERTREIGLRKALGATDRDVFVQLLLETVLVTAAAGAAGALLGWLAVRWTAAQVPPEQILAPVPYIEPTTAGAIALLLAGVGVASGVLPARRAARIEPAVSLRSV